MTTITLLIPPYQPQALINAEARVLPRAQIGHILLGDHTLGQQQRKDLLFPEFEARFSGQLGQRRERAVGQENSFGHQRMDVGTSPPRPSVKASVTAESRQSGGIVTAGFQQSQKSAIAAWNWLWQRSFH